MEDPNEVAVLAERFRAFSSDVARRLPLYRHLTARAADDPDVVARLLLAPPAQRIPNLLLAAVHDVLLGGTEDDLAAWYASLTDPARPIGTGDDDPWPHFRRLALTDADVARNLRTRATQTNEVGRCAALVPALAEIGAGGRTLGLVEVGASAGLNLLLDRYGYRYEPSGDRVGDDSLLTLTCETRGSRPVPVPAELPTVASKVGLDLAPVDLSDRRQARWLSACQWPDQPERLHRVRRAIAIAHGDRPRVVQGDAVDDVAPLVEGVEASALPVVIATWVLAYLTVGRQRAFLAELDRVGGSRDLTLVFAERPALVPGLPVPPRPDGLPDGNPTALVRVDWRDGRRSQQRLADLHPHGTWLEWLTD